jgi:hypothetical protein
MKLVPLAIVCCTIGAMARMTPSNRAPADMGNWLEDEADGIAIHAILRNIHPQGTLPGVVVSSQSRTSPVCLFPNAKGPYYLRLQNYYFHWVRDAAITMNNFVHYYSQGQF